MEKKQRPILFSTEMIKSILSGRKSQTRRIVKGDHNKIFWNQILLNGYGGFTDDHGRPVKCPYGVPGDELWVRETFCELYDTCDHDELPGCPQERWSLGYKYKADGYEYKQCDGFWKGWKPSIHMPRAACRLFLEITDIKVERLQDISEEDAVKEGVELKRFKSIVFKSFDGFKNYYKDGEDEQVFRTAKESFRSLWMNINGEQSWNDSPWVWCIHFSSTDKI